MNHGHGGGNYNALDMLILQALERQPMHGWGIAERIEALSREVFHLQTGPFIQLFIVS